MQSQASSKLAYTTIFLLLFAFALSYLSLQVPEVVSKDAENQFSATRALQRLSAILPEDNQPHPVNSVANDQVRENIIRQLSELGLDAEIQNAMGCYNRSRVLQCARVNNIISTIPGTDSSNTVLLMAHYDSVPAGPGAGDAGQAVASVLELVDLLLKQAMFKNDLIILFNEGEEFGLLGAEAFMAEHPLAKTVDLVINLEARGNQGKSLLFETGEDNYRLLKLFQQNAKAPLSNSITYEVYKLLPNDTDFTVLKDYGKTGVNFAFQGRLSHYHTPLDNLQNLSPGSVQHQGDNAYAMLLSLLMTDVTTLPEGNAVYTDVLSSFMVVWPEYLTIPLTFFAIFLLLLIIWQLLVKNRINLFQLTLALSIAMAVVVLTAVSNWILLFIVQYLSDQSQPWLSQPVAMRAAIWILPFAVSIFIANQVKDRLGFWGQVLAGYLLLLFIAIATSIYMPGASYLVLLPLLVFTILTSTLIIVDKLENTLLTSTALLAGVVTMAILVFPLMLILEDTMGFAMAPVFAVLESLVILLVLPFIITAPGTVIKRFIYVTGIISLLGLLISTQQNAFSNNQPQALNFEYLQQKDTASIQALSRHPLPQKIIAESAFSNQQKIARPWSLAEYPSITTTSLSLPEPELEVISNIQTADSQQLTLRYTSQRTTSRFMLYTEGSNRLQKIKLGKRSFRVPATQSSQFFQCAGLDCNGMKFTLFYTGTQPLKLSLVDYNYGLPEPLEYVSLLRGETAQPIQTGDTSLVHKKFVIIAQSLEANINTLIEAPVAKKIAYKLTAHGDSRIDNYYWMRDDQRKDPEILAHLEAENAYTKAMLLHTKDLQQQLYNEITGRIEKNDDSVPYKKGNYWYFSRYEAGKEYPIYGRQNIAADSEQEITLDVNQLVGDHEFFSVSGLSYSPDEKLLAYGEDTLSRRIYSLNIKNLQTGELLSDRIEGAEASTVWSADSQYLFYIKKDLETLLGNKVYRHQIGTPQTDDVLVYEELDTALYLGLDISDDNQTIVISRSNSDSASALFLDANKPLAKFRLFQPHETFIQYFLQPVADTFYLLSNRDAVNFQVFKVHRDAINNPDQWQLIIPHRDNVLIDGFESFNDHLAVSEKVLGLNQLIIYDTTGNKQREISFDDAAYSMDLSANPVDNSHWVRIRYSSMTTPDSIIDINMNTGERELKKQDKVLGDFDAERYQSERLFVTATDGKKIPVSLVYRKDRFNRDGSNPLYQYAYGSYGSNVSPGFRSSILSLLDRGFVFAIAHVRGSSTLGRQWYQDGKLLNKKNTFTDFIDVTKALVAQKYAAADKVVAAGGSAGGLLIGAIANMAPELYLGLSAHVPWVDVVTTMSDPSIPLTTNEYTEWGNPADKEYYDYMLSYSPYDQVKAQNYPNMFITTGLHDSQVQYFEPSKWVAKLRELKTDNNILLYDINMEAGHGGASGRFRRYEIMATEYAFYFDLLGITE